MMRAVGIGALLAILVVGVAAALLVSGVVRLPGSDSAPERVLVILTAPDTESAEVAVVAFVLQKGNAGTQVLDTTKPATVANTSADNAREAYPFVGADGVAGVLSAQTGGEKLDWLAVPAEAWSPLVEPAGGVELDVPEGLSIYRDGALVVLEPGRRRLDGEQIVALLSALDFVGSQSEREKLGSQSAAALAAFVSSDFSEISTAVRDGKGSTSMSFEQLSAFESEE